LILWPVQHTGIWVFLFFFLAYALVPMENYIHLRKSKPVMLAAGLIWIFVALADEAAGDVHTAMKPSNPAFWNMPNSFFFC
jgi:hypothetical protein